MTTCEFSLSKDFKKDNSIDKVKFIHDIQIQKEFTSELINIDVNDDQVILKFENELSVREQELLREVVETHEPCCCDFDRLAILSDEKEPGVNGGDSVEREWITRDLNKLHGSNIDLWITLNTNTFTLAEGSYFLTGTCRTLNVGKNKLRLFDVTNNKPVFYGMNSTKSSNTFIGYFKVPLNGPEFRIEQCCERARLQTGLGVADNFGGPEIYSQITIKKNN